MKHRLLIFVIVSSALFFAACPARAATFQDVESFAVPTQARQLVYSSVAGTLVLRNSASEIVWIDLATKAETSLLATYQFTDITLSPSGRYLFATDSGGEGFIGVNPAAYVYRVDLLTNARETRGAYVAFHVQPVSDTQIILKSIGQWVTFTNCAWGSGSMVVPLNTPSGYWGPGYYAVAYNGNIRYDFRTGRLIHGSSGSSSQEVKAWKLVNNEFFEQEATGVYGSAQSGGGTVVLSSDGRAFYYGPLQIDALDVTHNLNFFPEPIFAASGSLAFGNGKYFDAKTGAAAGVLPFATTVYALNPLGDDFWAYDPATSTVHHFVPDAPAASAFNTLPPCRAVDTRDPAGPLGGPALGPGARTFALAGTCGVPPDAKSLALNVTAVAPTLDGDLKLYPAGQPVPVATTISFTAGRTRANNALMAVSTDGTASLAVQADVAAGGALDLVVDVVGFFR